MRGREVERGGIGGRKLEEEREEGQREEGRET